MRSPPLRPAGARRHRADRGGQRAGFSLAEIRELLDGFRDDGVPGAHVRVLAERKLAELDALIERATAVRGWLRTATDCRCPTLADCGLFDAAPAAGEGWLRPQAPA